MYSFFSFILRHICLFVNHVLRIIILCYLKKIKNLKNKKYKKTKVKGQVCAYVNKSDWTAKFLKQPSRFALVGVAKRD